MPERPFTGSDPSTIVSMTTELGESVDIIRLLQMSWEERLRVSGYFSGFYLKMNSMKIVIPLHFISLKKDSKRCCDTTTPESIHTKDESKRGSAFAFIFGVN